MTLCTVCCTDVRRGYAEVNLDGDRPVRGSPLDASRHNVTAAARDYHDRTGTRDVQDADPELVEQVLAAHPADG